MTNKNMPPLKNTQKVVDNIKIHNIVPDMERTFLPVGTRIGKYRIIEEIDRGGMAVVYKALQTDLDRIIALKILPANITINRRFVERFLSEAHSIAKLNHPNIVSIHEVAMENNVYYLAMDYIPGRNLYYYLNLNKPKLMEVIELTISLIDALAYAHSQKIIHRDLKLNNVIMKENRSPVLIDFGLAKALGTPDDATITKTGEIMGSPAYMAPERVTGGETDNRSDICSLGIMFYEMLTFKNPYLDPRSMQQTTLNVMEAHPIAPRRFVTWLPIEIEAITLKAMAKDPEKRYQTMEEFGDDLKRYQRGEQVLAQPPSMVATVRYVFRKFWAPIIIGLLLLSFTSISGYWLYMQNVREKPRWQLVYEDSFDQKDLPLSWKKLGESGGDWRIEQGMLKNSGGAPCAIRLERSFIRDLKIEFDVAAESLDFCGVGFFLYGATPDSGYRFVIHNQGSGENGIIMPGSDFLHSLSNLIGFPLSRRYHVIIERKDNVFSFQLNNLLVEKIWDFFPRKGISNQNLGFFTNGSAVSFDNIRIYRGAIPLIPSPTLTADWLAGHGDFLTAFDEYRDLMVDFSRSPLVHDIKLKTADCCIRTGNDQEALKLLQSVLVESKSDEVKARALFLLGILDQQLNRADMADSVLSLLAKRYPTLPVAYGAFSVQMQQILDNIDGCELDLAQEHVEKLVRAYPRLASVIGALQVTIQDRYIHIGAYERALDVGRRGQLLFATESDVATRLRVNMGRIYLCKEDKQKATEMFNHCIAGESLSQGAWEAWMELAAMYEFDGNVHDARTVYQKVYTDCPKSIMLAYIAKLRIGELEYNLSSPTTAEMNFSEVVTIMHPFPQPRLIARFYLGQITEETFLQKWKVLCGSDPWCYYYVGQRNFLHGNLVSSLKAFTILRQNLFPGSWKYRFIDKKIMTLEKLVMGWNG